MSTILAFIGRVLIALLFIISGINKFADLSGTQAMLSGAGLPANLAVATAVFEIVAGAALVLGVLTRLFALLLAGFCLVTAFFFHNQFMDPVQAAMMLKNVAIAGGLLCLCAVETFRWSYDEIRDRRRRELEVRDAELREARTEGRLEGHQVG
jgi:putative oxidoreductase